MYFKRAFLLFVFSVIAIATFAQSCPANIGFEAGDLSGWKCYAAHQDMNGILPIIWGDPIDGGIAGRHTIIKNSSPQTLDPNGGFPINSPNGSQYSLMLGNAEVNGNAAVNGLYGFAERITYDFVVPSDDFTMVYYYAVVIQSDPRHGDAIQSKFLANLINVDHPGDVDCGAFSFTATAGLNGFIKKENTNIYYKAWSPLTIKIKGHKNANYRLEFITRDCSPGGHFGYAYLDFNEDCSKSAITGNNYCDGASDVVKLTAPAGFQTYVWKDKDGKVVGNEPTLKLSPIPANGTPYFLHIVPFPGLGCDNDFSTTIQKVNEPFILKVLDNKPGCLATGVDLTDPQITAGSSADMKYEYYTDADGQNFLSDPKLVKATGDYYIRGSNGFGCTDIAKIHVELSDGPVVHVNSPNLSTCAPDKIDITKAVTVDDPAVVLTYYSDAALKNVVPNPKAIATSGIYYIQGVVPTINCTTVTSVNVVVSPLPLIADKAVSKCPDINLITVVTDGGDIPGGIKYIFYTDQAGTNTLADPTKISVSGTYYYRAVNQYNCPSEIKKIDVIVYPVPNFTVTQPGPVIFPETVDLAAAHPTLSFADFTYWKDAACTVSLPDYRAVAYSGTFYIKAKSFGGCEEIHPVTVLVNAPPEPDLIVGNTFTPNGDGINDEFKPKTKGIFILNYLKIVNRYGKEVFQTKEILDRWNGTLNGKPEPVGTYFWVFSAYDIYRKKDYTKSGSVTIIR